MKARFSTAYGSLIAILVLTAGLATLAAAQTSTNSSGASASNAPTSLTREVERLEEHPLTFGLDGVRALNSHSLMGEPLWKYAASVVYLFLAFAGAKLLDAVARVCLRRVAARSQGKLNHLLLDLLRGPIKIVALAIFLNIGLNIFDWPPRARLYFSNGMIVVVAASLTWLLMKVCGLSLEVWREHVAHDGDGRFDSQLIIVLRRALSVAIVIIAALVTAQNIGINITAALASLSIGGIAVGLAAQDTLSNLFGAVAVFADKPFRVGDRIKLDVAEGVVESVGLRSTRVRSPEGHLVAIPNKTMNNAAIINISCRPGIRTVINLVLAGDTPAAKLKRAVAVISDVYSKHPMTTEVKVSFNQFSGRNFNILILHWHKDAEQTDYLSGLQEMNLALKERLDAEGINLA